MFYNSLEDITDAVRSLNPTILNSFEASCFDGRYVTPEVTPQYIKQLEARRGHGRTGAVGVLANLAPAPAPDTPASIVHAGAAESPVSQSSWLDASVLRTSTVNTLAGSGADSPCHKLETEAEAEAHRRDEYANMLGRQVAQSLLCAEISSTSSLGEMCEGIYNDV